MNIVETTLANNWGGFWLLYSPWVKIQCGDAS
jgi:hypothetical protein